MNTNIREVIDVAVQFTHALAQRDYALAYDFTTLEYQKTGSENELQEEFERIVPLDWGEIEILLPEDDDEIVQDWPDKEPSDFGWIYLGIAGSLTYPWVQGLYILISREGSSFKIRAVEFGRP